MVIMLIFLVLSVILLVATAIYTMSKNRQNGLQQRTKIKQRGRLEDILQIEIHDNIICLGNRHSKIVSLGNIDYNILSEDEQTTIEFKLTRVARAIDYPIQFYTTTEFIDTSTIIRYMNQNAVKNEKVKEYKEHLVNFLQKLMDNRVVSIIKSYAIISYDGVYDNARNELNRQVMSFKNSMLDANISCEELSENEIFDLLYRELNKNSVNIISNLKEGGTSLYGRKKAKEERKRYI